MEPTFYADILFFAVVAGFIAYRLYTVLGRKDGTEQNLTHKVKEAWEAKMKKLEEEKSGRPVTAAAELPNMTQEKAPATKVDLLGVVEEARSAVQEIMAKDRQFAPARFLEAAKSAFTIILQAHAEGDKDTLKNLLDEALYKEFEADILARGEVQRIHKLVALVRAEITAARLTGTLATLTVEIESEQINYTKDSAGAVLSGDTKNSERLHDRWVFTRDINSRSPVWQLVDTDEA